MNKCIGCGVFKQVNNPNEQGYVLKKENEYCLRCFRINNYNDLIPQDISQQLFLQKISETFSRSDNEIEIYYIVDIFDFDGSRINQLESIISKYKVNILVNKIDLLPKSVKLSKVRNYVSSAFKNSILSHANIILCTALKQNFIFSLVNKLNKSNSKTYFVGASNVGKSSIINAILKANKLIPKIVVSNYFNTTLDFIEISLNDNKKIVDTPGVARKDSLANLADVTQQKYFYFNKEVKQITYQLNPNNSIFLGTACWLDFNNSTGEDNSFHILANRFVKTHRTNTSNALNYYQKNKKLVLPSIICDQIQTYDFEFDQKDFGNKYDILISGIGWINFNVKSNFRLKINIPLKEKNVGVFLRKALI